MHHLKSLLVVASVTPLVLADPRDSNLVRRIGEEVLPSIPSKDNDTSASTLSTFGNTAIVTQIIPTGLTTGVVPPPLGTGGSATPVSTQNAVVTEIVYTTLTTCPVTNTIVSGTSSTLEVTTTISTVTRTSTSTICSDKCTAPPNSQPVLSSKPAGETATSSLPSFYVYSLTQPSLSFSSVSPPIPLTTAGTLSKPEIIGTAISSSKAPIFPFTVSLAVSATSGASSTLEIPGYSIVPPPTTVPGSPPLYNATASTIPVFTPSLLGSGYGGGFVRTPSIYVTTLPFPSGPSAGVPPGYGFSSKPETPITIVLPPVVTSTIGSNATVIFTGLGLPSVLPVDSLMTADVSPSVFTATYSSNISVPIGTLAASSVFDTSSQLAGNAGFTPTFVSLSPFGGKEVHESGITRTLTDLVIGASAGVSSSSIVPAGGLPEETSTSGTIGSPVGSSENSASSPVSSETITTGSGASSVSSLASSGTNNIVSNLVSGLSALSATIVAGGLNAQVSSASLASQEIDVLSTTSISEQVAILELPTTLANGQVVDSPTTSVSGQAAAVESSTTLPNGQVVVVALPTSVNGPAPTVESSTTLVNGQVVVIALPTSVNGQAPTVESSATLPNGQVVVVALPTMSVNGQPAAVEFSTTLPNGQVAVVVLPTTSVTGNTAAVDSSATLANGQVIGLPVTLDTGEVAAVGSATTLANGQVAVVQAPTAPAVDSADSAAGISVATLPESTVSFSPISAPLSLEAGPVGGINIITTGSLGSSDVPTSSTGGPSSEPSVSNILLSSVDQGFGPLVTLAIGSSEEQAAAAGQPAASTPTPVAVGNGVTSLAVIPSPIVGANGLTSLAVFSTPVAAAAGLTSPAVLLTPVVGANGLTSLAVLATPVVGANGLTSLAIGFATETTPTAGQANATPSPVEGFVLIKPEVAGSGEQAGIPTSSLITASGGMNLPSAQQTAPAVSGNVGSGNDSVHVQLNPTAATLFEGSAVKLSSTFALAIFGLFVFIFLL